MSRGILEREVSPTRRQYSRTRRSNRSRALPVNDCAVLSLRDDGDDRLSDQRLEERLFVLEVEIDGALGHAGATGDVLELGRGKAPVGEDLESSGNDFFRTGVFTPAPPRTEGGAYAA